MHPAGSIVVFTTLSGLGYGLAAVIGLGVLDATLAPARTGWVIALGLIVVGLLSSTFHLGHPERAWRALSQWRSSWLSREGVVAIIAFLPLGLAALGSVIFAKGWATPGFVGALIALFTVYCTSMIYGSIKAVHHWATPLTSACYLFFSIAGGLIAASALAAAFGEAEPTLPGAALAMLAIAWATKLAWWNRAFRTASASTPESATGLGQYGKVRLLERPHITENYLTREMGFKVARKHATKIRRFAIGFGFVVPAMSLFTPLAVPASTAAAIIMVFGAICHLLGMLMERWLFFAEAKHTVMLYYGEEAA